MRRNEQDIASQPVRNTITNPAMVTKTSGTDTLLTNYAPNPDFTGTTVTMGGIGGNPASFTTTAIATDRAHSGTRSFKMATCTVAGQVGRKMMLTPTGTLKLVKGQKVSWSLWVYSTVAGTMSPYWEGRKVADNSYVGGGATAVAIPANQWTYVSGTSTAPVDSYVDGAGAYNLNVNVGDSVWFDDFCITQTDTPQPYFDGSTPAANGYAYSWSGTAYNSSSVRKAAASVVRTNLVANPSFKGGTLSNIRTNLLNNPSFENSTSTTDVWTNHVMNPSFRTTSGTTEVRKNLITNPSFEVGSGTVDVRTNQATNPSMENTSGTVAARYNLVTHPNFETAGSLTAVRTNYSTNPSMESAGSAVVVRTNLAHDPRATASNDTWGRIGWRTARWFGGGSGTGTHTFITGAGDGPLPSLTTYVRKTWTVAGNSNGDTGFEHSFGGVNGLPVTAGTTYTVSSYLRVTGTSKAGAIQINFYDAAGALLSAVYPAGGNTTLPSGVWTRLTHTVVAPTNSAFMHIISDVDTGTLWAPGEYLDGTGLLIELSSIALPYFDGSTAAAENLTYAWTGTANVSSSEQRGVHVSGRQGLPPERISWQSSTRALSGTKSAQVLIKNPLATNTTLWYPAVDYAIGTGAGQLPASTTLTWSVYVYIPSGSPAKVMLCDVTSGGTYGTPSADLYDQWQRITHTFTTPASGICQLRLRTSGAGNVAGTTFWIDDELIEASPVALPYFDGSSTQQNLVTNPSFATNTTGWSPISATLTRVTNQGGDGHVGELTQTVDASSRNTAIWIFGGDQPAGAYTVSFDMKGTDASFTNVRTLLYDTETALVRASGSTPLIKDGNFNRYTFSLTADGVFDRVYMEVQGVGIPIGTKAWIDRAKIERTPTASTVYYEGNGDFTYAWTGTAHASSSVQQATTFPGWAQLGYIYRTTMDPKMGTYSGAIGTLGRSGDGLWPVDMDVIAGKTYTVSAWIKATSVHALTAAFRWKDAALAIIGADTNVTVTSQLVVGSWALVSATATAPANAVKAQLMYRIYEAHTPTTFYIDGVVFTESQTPVPYFDGSTAASGDFTYAWTGTANISTSVQRGVGVVETSTGSVAAISSTEWKGTGTKSLRLVTHITTSNDTFTSFSGDTGAMRLGMVAGKTYTISATCRLAAPLTGTLSVRSRRVVLFYKAAADQNYTEVQSTQAPNTAGESRVSLTFTIPANATEAFIRLYSGTYAGNGDVWWDNLLVEESPILRPYFDGTVPAVENLVKTSPNAYNGLTATTNVNYAGQLWTRGTVPAATSGAMFRQFVNLSELRQGERYTVSVTVANDQTTDQQVWLDWGDTAGTGFVIKPGEVRRIAIYGSRTFYDNVYNFADLNVTESATQSRSILVKDWMVEIGQTAGDYYFTGTGDFTYAWTGTANASTSVQRATAVTGVSAPSYLCRAFQSSYNPTIGTKTLRVTGTSTSNDVFAEFNSLLSGYTFKANTTYTLAADRILPAPLVGSSLQLCRANIGNTEMSFVIKAAASNVAGRSRFVVTFKTGAETNLAFIRLYSGTPAGGGDVWFDRLTLEEGFSDGSYFDGDTPNRKNLVTNPSLETDSMSWNQWPGVTGTSVATRETSGGFIGSAFFRVTWNTSQTGSNLGGGFVDAPGIIPGMTYSARMKVRPSKNQTIRCNIEWLTVVGTAITSSTGLDTAVTANVWSDIKIDGAVAPPNASFARVTAYSAPLGTAWLAGDTLDLDTALVEASPTASPYYEGNGDFTYAWVGTAHASASTQKAAAAVGNVAAKSSGVGFEDSRFLTYQSTDETGKKIGRWFSAAGSPNSNWRVANITPASLNYAAIFANQTYTLIVRYRSSGWGASQSFNISLKDATSQNPVISDESRTLNTGWTEYRRTFTALISGLASTNLYIALPVTPQAATDGIFDISEWALVPGTYTGPFFDGSSVSTSADYSYLWTGTADASTSVLRGNHVTNVDSANFGDNTAKPITSTEWSASTGKSMRIIPVGPGSDTSINLHGSASSGLGSMVAGKTYTVKGTFRQTAPQTGNLHTRARSIMFADSVTGWAAAPVVAATNTAGSQTLTHTFTVPAAATWATVRLYNGAAGGGGDVWWDDVVMVEGPYTGNYFDGNTAASGDFSYAWSGTANASTSYQKAPNLANWGVETKINAFITSTGTLKIEVKDPNGGGGRSVVPFSSAGVNLGLTSGNKYTIKARGKKLDSASGYNIAGALIGALPLTTSMSDITLTLTAGTGPIYLEHPSGSNTAGTEWEYFGIFNEGDPVTYFDGDTSGADGLINRWKGTPNASQSEQIGATVSGYGVEPNIKPWALPDGAMRTVNISGTTHSLQVPNSTVNGRTYTVLARAKSYRSGNFRIYGLANTPLVTLTTSYDWYRLTGVATGTTLYFSTQGASGSGFDISHLMVVEGTYTGGYVDGTSYGARWEGTANAATSLGNPTSLESIAGKPLFSNTAAGNYVLSSVGVPTTSPRTIYSIVDNIADVPIASQSIALSYGITTLNDTIPNTYLIMRQQGQEGPTNSILTRRTLGAGAHTLGVPSSGRHILIGGINPDGYLFSGFDNSALTIDNVVVAIPHERIIIEANSSYHQHIITYVYQGFHNDSMRAEIIKLLALKHNVNLSLGQ